VVREEAARVDCALRLPGTHFEWDFRDGALSYESQRLRLDSVTLRMQGAHQGLNAACAVAAVEALCEQAELKMPDPWNVASALGQARLTGRLERVRSPGGPAFLLDGAHNPAGARALGAALSERRRPRQRVWLLASMQDKARAEMLAELLPHVDRVLCTRGTSSPRFESPEQLVSELEEAGAQAGVASSVQAAVGALTRELGPRDEVLVAGSLYLVGDVRHALGLPVS